MESKKVLVVVSHGSKRQESNQEFKDFIKKLNLINSESKKSEGFGSLSDQVDLTDLSGNYTEIKGACLEFTSPQLEKVIEDLVRSEYKEIDILPLFIFAGYHVRQDIPERMEELKNKYRELNYRILDHPAAGDNFAYYIFKQALIQK